MPAAVPPSANAALLLSDGGIFFGYGVGAEGTAFGEVCFNTAMTGYQEILTDPSYAGQVICFTFPHIGNVGCNAEDIESTIPRAKGLILREAPTAPSSFRSETHLNDWLVKHGITGISGIDTRALTRHIRKAGAPNVAIVHAACQPALVAGSEAHPDEMPQRVRGDNLQTAIENARAELSKLPSMAGMELACGVSTGTPFDWKETRWQLGVGYGALEKPKRRVVAFDFGEKLNILRSLASHGCEVVTVPATSTAKDIMALKPDGVFLSNGPGDPAATAAHTLPAIAALIEQGVPMFGICLGHQLIGLALGAKTEKMHQGHRGANHPVKNLLTGKVEITAQNHGFAVAKDGLPADLEITHVSLFDGTVQGIRHKTKPVFGVQYHPESSPGPHDSRYLFEQFVGMMEARHA